MRLGSCLLVCALALLAVPPTQAEQIGFRAWGLRAGVADDPDQVLVGVHFNLGEFVDDLRFQPDAQVGLGDDHTTLFVHLPAYYRFRAGQDFTPYAGGGISMGLVDRDLPPTSSGDETDFEIGAKVTGGLEWPLRQREAVFVELSLGFGDIHDAQIVVGWTF